MGDEITLGPEN